MGLSGPLEYVVLYFNHRNDSIEDAKTDLLKLWSMEGNTIKNKLNMYL